MSITLPGPTLGVVGGGQLGRMLAEAASPLGVEVLVVDPTPNCPAAPVVRDQIVADFDDPDGLAALAKRADALTFEIELADPDHLSDVSETYGVPVHPDPATLETIQDKLVQKESLADAGIPVPDCMPVATADGLERLVEEFGGVMLKAREGGYDGRGNVPVEDPADAATALESIGGHAMAERLIPFERELAIMGVKGADGATRTYPVTETIHREEILRESVTPARVTDDVAARAVAVAEDVLDWLGGRGVYGIEMFETADGSILVNEIAPRPHNSGHWTIEGARVSQFENHVRAVLGWPIGATDIVSPAVTTNVLGDVTEPRAATLSGVESVLAAPDAALHWYGKQQVRPLRKMGHVTVTESYEAPHKGINSTEDGTADAPDNAVDTSDKANNKTVHAASRDALLSQARALRDDLTFADE